MEGHQVLDQPGLALSPIRMQSKADWAFQVQSCLNDDSLASMGWKIRVTPKMMQFSSFVLGMHLGHDLNDCWASQRNQGTETDGAEKIATIMF
jgi:hypothetical protein